MTSTLGAMKGELALMRRYVGALLTIVVLAVLGEALAIGLGHGLFHPQQAIAGANQGTTTTPQGTLKHVSLTLQTFPFDPYTDPDWIAKNVTGKTLNGETYPTQMGDNASWVKYWPTSVLIVPAHTLVTITIQNYDTATPLLNPFYAIPRGLTDESGNPTNAMTVDGKPVTSADPTNVSHTFTIHSIPNAGGQPWLFVSVPLTAVSSSAPADAAGLPNQPVVTQFSFITGAPGHYVWQCFDPCGSNYNGFGGPMETKGYMNGTFTVV